MSTLTLNGLRGDNPLAYMAAVGALVVADRILGAQGRVRLGWSHAFGKWRPTLRTNVELSESEFLSLLHRGLHRKPPTGATEDLHRADQELKNAKKALKDATKDFKDEAKRRNLKKGTERDALAEELVRPAQRRAEEALAERTAIAEAGASPDETTALGQHLKVPLSAFACFVKKAAQKASADDRRTADFAAAFGSELIAESSGNLQPTRFGKTNGAGSKNMLLDMAILMREMSIERLAASLFHDWDYADKTRSLGWDPADARPYALLATNPDKGAFTMHGANLLAYEALVLFTTAVQARQLHTIGTSQQNKHHFFTWPIWTPMIGTSVLRSLLALRALQTEAPDRDALRAMGIEEVFRAEHFHFTDKKFLRFRPARAV